MYDVIWRYLDQQNEKILKELMAIEDQKFIDAVNKYVGDEPCTK